MDPNADPVADPPVDPPVDAAAVAEAERLAAQAAALGAGGQAVPQQQPPPPQQSALQQYQQFLQQMPPELVQSLKEQILAALPRERSSKRSAAAVFKDFKLDFSAGALKAVKLAVREYITHQANLLKDQLFVNDLELDAQVSLLIVSVLQPPELSRALRAVLMERNPPVLESIDWFEAWLHDQISASEAPTYFTKFMQLKTATPEVQGRTYATLVEHIQSVHRSMPDLPPKVLVYQALSLCPPEVRKHLLMQSMPDRSQVEWKEWSEFVLALRHYVSDFPGAKGASGSGKGSGAGDAGAGAGGAGGSGGGNSGRPRGGQPPPKRHKGGDNDAAAGAASTGGGAVPVNARFKDFDEKNHSHLWVVGLSRAESLERKKAGKCLICNGAGHVHKHCPKRSSLYDQGKYWYFK